MKSYVTNNGTVNLGAGELAIGKTITGGTLNINGDVTANAGDIMGNTNAVAKGKTLTLNGSTGSTIAKTISGEGTLKVMANMSVNADNLQTSTTLVESGKTLTITGGTFDKKVGGDGTLNITGTLHFGNNAELVQTDTQTVGDKQIPVSNVNITLASGGTFDVRDRENTTGGCINILTFAGGRIDASGGHVGNMLVANTLDASTNGGGSISFDVAGTGAGGTNTNDQIGVLNSVVSGSTLNLDSINVVGELNGNSGSIVFVNALLDQNVLDNLTIAGTTTTMSGNYMYTFTPDTENKGKLNYTKEIGIGLMQVIQAKDTDGNYMDSYAKVDTYSFTGDRGKNFEPYSQSKLTELGTAKTDAENLNKRFGNLGIMGHATSRTLTIVGNGSELSGGTYEGVTVGSGDTLVLKNISAITDAKGNIIATNNGTVMFTGSGTTDVRATIKGGGTLIVDGVNVVLGENYQYIIGRTALTAAELTNLKAKVDGGTATEIETKEYNFGWKLNADGSYVTTLSENTSASITQDDLEIHSGSLTANADNLHITNGIVNNGEMTFTGGTLSTELKGAGQYSNIGTMTVEDTSKLQMTNGLENTGTLNLGNSTNSVLGADITGTGTTVIAGNVSNNGKTITQNILNITGTFTTDASKLVIAKVINNSGNVSFNGGTLAQKVQGTGNITFDGNVTTNANYIATTGTNTVASGKTLTFNAGTLAKKIEGAGNLSFGGNVTTNADNIATEGTNEVTSSAKLAFAGGTLTKAITGDGTAEFNNTVSVANDVNLGTNINNVNGTLDVVEHITASNISFQNGSTLKVDGTKIIETAAITGITSATVASGAKLYVSNAEKDTAYKILAGSGGIDVSSWTTDDNMGEGFRASYGLVVDTDNTTTAGTELSEFHIQFKEDPVATGSSDIGNIIANLPAGSEAKVWIDNISANQPDVQTQGNIVNTMANMNSLANVQQGTQAVMAMATDALQTNIGTGARPMLGYRGQVSGVRKSGGLRNVAVNAKDTGKIETVEQGKSDEVMPTMVENEEQKYDKTVWANYIHSKKTIDGLKTGHLTQNSTIQYNGVTVGADLWSNAKGFGGLALTTAEGKTNSSQDGASVKNDTDYHGVSLYQRYDYKDVALLFDLSYTHAKNDVTMSTAGTTDVTAKPKSDAYSAGVKVEYPVKIGHSSQLTPYTGVRYTHIHTDKYENSLGISNDIKDQNLVNIPIGVQLKTEYATQNGWRYGHIFEGGYVWNVGNRQSEQRLGYLGVYDSIDFDVTDRGEYFLKTAFTARHKDTDFELGYRYTKGDNTKDNKWNFNVTYNFGNANGMPYKSVLLGKIDLLESANKALRAELVEVKAENKRKDMELAEKDAEIERLKALLRAKG